MNCFTPFCKLLSLIKTIDMKFILPALSLVLLSALSHAQSAESSILRNIPTDTTVRTSVEAVLRQKNGTQKVEYMDGGSVGGLYYSIIVAHNITTGRFEKGVYVNSDSWPGLTSFNSKTTPHAYIDENEIADLIKFFQNCDTVWKKTPPDYRTSYEYETKDGFRISFGAGALSNNWRFAFQFRNYQLYHTEIAGKGRSADLLHTFKLIQEKIGKIAASKTEGD